MPQCFEEKPKGCELVPGDIWADGNCFPRCVCLAAYGSQAMHQEMRVRLIFELVHHMELYLDNNFMCRGFKNEKTCLANLMAYSSLNWTGNLVQMMEELILDSINDGKYMGALHVAASASVLGRNVVLVYPDYGGYTVQPHLNRMFLPRGGKVKENVYILFTSTEGCQQEPKNFSVNHFALMLPRGREQAEQLVKERAVESEEHCQLRQVGRS